MRTAEKAVAVALFGRLASCPSCHPVETFRRWRLTTILIALLSGVACRAPTDAESDLSAALRRWAGAAPPAYEITLRRTCFCPQEVVGPVVVTVRGGRVESRRYLTGTPVDARFAESFPTVEGLFAFVDDAIRRRAAQITATYDSRFGYPANVFVDYEVNVADEENGFVVQEFRAVP